MHIPNEMLNGTICPVTALLSVIGVAGAALKAFWSSHRPGAARFAAVTALIFAGQMMNFPIQDGTSGHLIGGVLAASVLGIPFGILSMALVVTVQCLVFSDGGFSVLGANILNMAIIGSGIGGLINYYLVKGSRVRSLKYMAGTGIAAWISVMLAASACSVELAVSGTIAFRNVIGAMLGTHALIGIGEGIITAVASFALTAESIQGSKKRSVAVPMAAAGIIAVLLSPFASAFPDGLEWVAEKYSFLHESAPSFVSPFSDYSVSHIGNEILSVGIAGLAGVLITFAAAWVVAKAIASRRHPETL